MLVTRGLGGTHLVTAGLGISSLVQEIEEFWRNQEPRFVDGYYDPHASRWTSKTAAARIARQNELDALANSNL